MKKKDNENGIITRSKRKIIDDEDEDNKRLKDFISVDDFKEILEKIFQHFTIVMNNLVNKKISYNTDNNSNDDDDYSDDDYSDDDYSDGDDEDKYLGDVDGIYLDKRIFPPKIKCLNCKLCKKHVDYIANIEEIDRSCKKCKLCRICIIPGGRGIFLSMVEDKYFLKLDLDEKIKYINFKKEIDDYNNQLVPLKYRILESNINIKNKSAIMTKITQFESMHPESSEYFKIKEWIDGISKVRFDTFIKLPISVTDNDHKKFKFLKNLSNKLDDSIYGQIEAKNKLLQIVSQWLSNPETKGNIIALKGEPGVGKTTLIKNGLSKALNIPFSFITLGGAQDGAILEGHGFTYIGSRWGKIVDSLMVTKCMNPIIFFDELDKISECHRGQEIVGILTHLTDASQNDQFHDVYFSGIDFDLSKALFIFSYNDESLINKILLDRITVVQMDSFNIDDKIKIVRNYLLPEIEKTLCLDRDDIIISDESLRHIINVYTNEKGVRKLKQALETIYYKVNLLRYIETYEGLNIDYKIVNFKLPIEVDNDIINMLLKTDNVLPESVKRMYM